MKNYGLIVGLLLVILRSSNGKLPSSIHVCSRNDPELVKCVINSVTHLRPKLADGRIADDFILPALEPLTLDNIKMERGREFKATFSKLSVKGPSNFIIDKLRINLENTTFDLLLTLPKLDFVGKYDLRMKILVLDIVGNGDMQGAFENTRGRVRMRAKKFQRDGETYLKFDTFDLKIQIGQHKLKLYNLFNGDKNLEKIGNQFINENSQLFLSEIIPGLEKNLADIFTKTANEIISTATFDEMFPEVAPKYD